MMRPRYVESALVVCLALWGVAVTPDIARAGDDPRALRMAQPEDVAGDLDGPPELGAAEAEGDGPPIDDDAAWEEPGTADAPPGTVPLALVGDGPPEEPRSQWQNRGTRRTPPGARPLATWRDGPPEDDELPAD